MYIKYILIHYLLFYYFIVLLIQQQMSSLKYFSIRFSIRKHVE
jgi:hypothetical protein